MDYYNNAASYTVPLLLLLLFFTGMLLPINAVSAQEIDFHTGEAWEQVLDMAASEDKLIFMDAVTSWCAPCKKMAQNVYSVDSVGDYFNEHFISVQYDIEHGEGKLVADKYRVQGYPTLIVLNTQGAVINRVCGYQSAEKLLQLARSARNNDMAFYDVERKYQAGDRSAGLMNRYLALLKKGCIAHDSLSLAYINSLKLVDLYKLENWEIFNEYVYGLDDNTAVNLILNNKQKFYKLYGEKLVQYKLIELFVKHYDTEHIRAKNAKSFNQDDFNKRVNELPDELKKPILLYMTLLEAEKMKKWPDYIETALTLTDKYGEDRQVWLARFAAEIVAHTNDKLSLNRALGWMERICATTDDPFYWITYAQLLDKTGDTDQAKQVLHKAKQHGVEKGHNEEYFDELADKLK